MTHKIPFPPHSKPARTRSEALLNFVLRLNGYPRLYPELGHREKYLDAVAKGNEADYQPIVALLHVQNHD